MRGWKWVYSFAVKVSSYKFLVYFNFCLSTMYSFIAKKPTLVYNRWTHYLSHFLLSVFSTWPHRAACLSSLPRPTGSSSLRSSSLFLSLYFLNSCQHSFLCSLLHSNLLRQSCLQSCERYWKVFGALSDMSHSLSFLQLTSPSFCFICIYVPRYCLLFLRVAGPLKTSKIFLSLQFISYTEVAEVFYCPRHFMEECWFL